MRRVLRWRLRLGDSRMIDQFWQPDRETRSSIRRGDKINREYFARKMIEYELIRLERLMINQGLKEAR